MRDAESFYARLATAYEETVRQPVPRCEEMRATAG